MPIDRLDPTNDFLVSPYENHVVRDEQETITVYRDPYFKTDPEDDALLLKKIIEAEQREFWLVQLTTGLKVRRWIKKEVLA